MLEKFAYNKSTIQDFQRQLKVRRAALPVLLRKETALRQVLTQLKIDLDQKKEALLDFEKELASYESIWNEFPPIIKVEALSYENENIAGTKVKALKEVQFKNLDLNILFEPAWLPAAAEALMRYVRASLEIENTEDKLATLALARKKTTQKVNLYEKVQIPAYNEAIRKIKRFLEDKENIATAAKKIAKNRLVSRHEK